MEGFYSHGNDVARNPSIPSISTVEFQESLPSSQSGLVFQSSEWDDSHLASAFLFLKEFCRELRAEKFDENLSDANMKGLLGACSEILGHIIPPASHVPTNSALGNPYKDALKPEKFKDYIEWLEKNIPEIKKSVGKLHNEALKLTEKQLKTGTSSGLSKYGFVCNNGPNGKILYRWPSQDYRAYIFMEKLEHLKRCIGKILKRYPKNSTPCSQVVNGVH